MAGWPWPLDGVQGWFEGLWNHVASAAQAAVSVVSDWINSAVSGLWTYITGAFSSLWSTISDAFSATWTSITGAISNITSYVASRFSSLWTSISSGLSSLGAGISGAFSTITTGISDYFSNLAATVAASLSNLWTSVSKSVGGLWTNISTGLSNLWGNFTEWGGNLVGNITTMFDGAMAAIGSWVSDALEGVAGALGAALSGFVAWTQERFNELTGWLVGGIQWLGDQLRSVFEALGAMIFAPITEALMPGSPPEPLGAVTADFGAAIMDNIVEQCKAIHKSPAQRELAVGAGAAVLGGITLMQSIGGALTMAFDATHPVKDWGTQDLFHRVVLNLMSSPVTSAILATPVIIGIITPMRQYFNAMFRPEIPGAGDLIRFVVREVITPAIFSEYMGFQGYSETISTWYWDAHWVLPAFGQLVDAYHRGIITSGDLDTFIVWHDYSPTKRPGVTKTDLEIMRGILKRLIPRVDLRYAWELGRITDEELVDKYEFLGYEEDAPLMAEIQMARALVEEVHKVRDQWISDFLGGFILEETLRANLAVIGIGPARIDYYVTYAKKRREREHNKRLLDIYDDAYFKDLKTYEELTTDVELILVDEDALDLFLTEAYIRKYKKPKAD